MTADEIAYLRLEGVRLAVLSACETGLGEVAGGEGLIGIQRAFQIAGARSTIASLWKVNDAATRRLMQEFYTNYLDKEMSVLDSLREAQLWAMKNPHEFLRGFGKEHRPPKTLASLPNIGLPSSSPVIAVSGCCSIYRGGVKGLECSGPNWILTCEVRCRGMSSFTRLGNLLRRFAKWIHPPMHANGMTGEGNASRRGKSMKPLSYFSKAIECDDQNGVASMNIGAKLGSSNRISIGRSKI